jgi:hypothetical protein
MLLLKILNYCDEAAVAAAVDATDVIVETQ